MGGASSIIQLASSSSSSSVLSCPKATDFKVYSTIGIGGFSKVESAKHLKSRSMVALKTTNITAALARSNGYEILTSEIKTLLCLGSHPFIAKLRYAYHDYCECCLALELYQGGDLRFQLDVGALYNEQCVSYLMGCMGSALQFMHSKGIIHRDIKPENIVLSKDGTPHLTDFGVSYHSEGTSIANGDVIVCKSTSGTKPYSSPEFLTRSRRHGTASDYWSLGITAFELLTGSRPFSSPPIEYIHYAEKADYYADFVTSIDSTSATALANDTQIAYQPTEGISASPSLQQPSEKPSSCEGGGADTSPILPLIGTYIPSSMVLSSHAVDFLTEILEPRIPSRLGGENCRKVFLLHPWIQPNTHLKKSPLKDVIYYVPVEGLSDTYLSRRVSNKGSCSMNPLVDVRTSTKYSDKVEKVLALYQYSETHSSSFSSSKKLGTEKSVISKSHLTAEISTVNPPSPSHSMTPASVQGTIMASICHSQKLISVE
jgi:serine/threonine protein kinase